MGKEKYKEFSQPYEDTKVSLNNSETLNKEYTQRKTYVVLSVVVTGLLVAAGVATGLYFGLDSTENENKHTLKAAPECDDPCVLSLVESIPVDLTFPKGSPSHPSTYSALMKLMQLAKSEIEIASYYWTLNGADVPYHDNSSWQGESVLQTLMSAGRDRKIKIKIAQNKPSGPYYNNTKDLAEKAGAEVRTLDFDALLGGGIIHTKMWLIDRKHFYVGSANLDWRSLTQVKEMGALVENCSCLAKDMGKLFDVYWMLGIPGAKVPKSWNSSYSTDINRNSSLAIRFNNTAATTYLSSSPPQFCPSGRTIDIDAITNIIQSAEQFVYVAVMDYFPTTQFTKPRAYWPVIDDAFRRAAFNKRVKVYLLISFWQHTWDDMPGYLKSLNDLYIDTKYTKINLQVRIFVVPAFTESQKKIPYARVNHNKYMVTDKTAYIGTSNWAGDYFITTAGIGLVVNQTRNSRSHMRQSGDVRQNLEDVFLRDWNSKYSVPCDKFNFTQPTYETDSLVWLFLTLSRKSARLGRMSEAY